MADVDMMAIAGFAKDIVRSAARLKRQAKSLAAFADSPTTARTEDIDANTEDIREIRDSFDGLTAMAVRIIEATSVAKSLLPLLEE